MNTLMNPGPKIFLCIFAILLLSGFHQNNNQAQALLDQSSAYLNQLDDLSAKFHYQLESPQSGKISQKGLLMFKDLKYVLKMDKYDIYFDGLSHTLYSSETNQYKVMEQNPAQGIGLVHFMYSIYTKDSEKAYQGKEKINGKLFHKIHLKMKDKKVPYKEAVLWMNPDTKLIEEISFIDLKKTITTYRFSEIITNPGFEDSDFVFDAKQFPGSEEIDED